MVQARCLVPRPRPLCMSGFWALRKAHECVSLAAPYISLAGTYRESCPACPAVNLSCGSCQCGSCPAVVCPPQVAGAQCQPTTCHCDCPSQVTSPSFELNFPLSLFVFVCGFLAGVLFCCCYGAGCGRRSGGDPRHESLVWSLATASRV